MTWIRWVFLCFACYSLPAIAQSSWISGRIIDQEGEGVAFVNVGIREIDAAGGASDEDGNFLIRVPYRQTVTLQISYIGYKPVARKIELRPNDTLAVEVLITRMANDLPTIIVKADNDRTKSSTFTLDPATVEEIPLPSGNFESLLKTIGLGVATTGGELSSQYSVRGGNFDENLIYVNDFEIYRPQLIRSGQQEGLSFINSDLVDNIEFSSGGFEARYGDKLSSVLDVTYKRPDSLHASFEASLLGANAHVEGASADKRFTFLTGVRYRTQQYLLNSLATTGQYTPVSADFQSLLRYKLSPSWELEWIANANDTRYFFVPVSRVTSIGTIDNVKQLEVFFEGQEVNSFRTLMSGISATYAADSNRLRLKFMASAYRSDETETFDVIGDYFLYQVESDLGSNEFSERLFALGYGTYQDYARNYLTAQVANLGHRGYYFGDRHLLEWGARYQYETIDDRLNEWQRSDSALYTLPYDTDQVLLQEVLKTRINLTSARMTGYLQDTWIIRDDSVSSINLTAGIRAQYWTVNQEWLVSPRAQLSYRPNWNRDVIWRVATGLYQQAPFYRELRDFGGQINRDVLAQKSWHMVVGADYVFDAWGGREFRLMSEAYFKWMWDLVPYEIEDVKIRYFGDNLARGYATGIDFRLNGEFVRDAESWVTLSVMQTQEDIEGDSYIDENGVTQEIGFLARPTDQRVNLGILFQDYLPNNDNFKVHLNLLFGSSLPFSPPRAERFRNAFRMPPYRRVDIGFSANIYDRGVNPRNGFITSFKSIWASLEVFNLLGIENTISHIWIKDNTNTSYAFENYLTNRRLNFRIIVKI